MAEKTIVRGNLMSEQGYKPYCGNPLPRTFLKGCDNPRAKFNGEQFVCPKCGWVSKLPAHFITRYKAKWNIE